MDHKKDQSPSTILIRIKSSNIPSDLTLPISSSLTVSQLKQSVQQSLGQTARERYIRLIHSGRLLAPDDAPIENFKLRDGSVIHVVVAAAGVRGGQQAELSRPEHFIEERRRGGRRRRIVSLRGAGIGEDGLILSRGGRNRGENEDSDDEDDEDLETGVERMGFDRLRADGLSRSEINALRVYFASQIDRYMEQRNTLRRENHGGRQGMNQDHGDDPNNNSNNNTGDHEEEDLDPSATARRLRLRMEDEWMQAQGPHSEFRLNLNANNPLIQRRLYMSTRRPTGMDPMYTGPLGSDRDFIWGFVLGYFIGFMMMFWVWIPTVPHRQKLGILTGICFHMGMNIINGGTFDTDDDANEG